LSLVLAEIRSAIKKDNISWKRHTLERMMERGLSRKNVKQAIITGSIIESYPNDYPFPSYLICTLVPEPLHAFLSYNATDSEINIITVYYPDLTHFKDDYITRQ